MKRIVFYTNQFFGQIGGEDMAYEKPQVSEGAVGPGLAFNTGLEDAVVVATFICGDNYYVENMEDARQYIIQKVKQYDPDLFIAGPAFNAGRFGIACADICSCVKKELGIEAITGLYWENPAVEMYKKDIYILEVGKSAATMRKATASMISLATKLLNGEPLGAPTQEGFFAAGKRVNVFKDKNGAERAVEMLLKKVSGEPFETELGLSSYEKVAPAPSIADLKMAKIAIITTGGIVPMGNPDHIPAATAKIWGRYSLEGMNGLYEGVFESIHAGYDPVYANKDPDRVVPVDTVLDMQKEGLIGSVYPFLIGTTGNSTSVSDATRMGKEMAELLINEEVSAAILTST